MGDVWFASWPRQTHREIPLIKLLLICLHFEVSTSSHLPASLFPSFLLLYHISLRQPGMRTTYPCWHRPGQAAQLFSKLRRWDSHITKLLGAAKQLRHSPHLPKTAPCLRAEFSCRLQHRNLSHLLTGIFRVPGATLAGKPPPRVGTHLKWADDTVSNSPCPCCYWTKRNCR